MIGAVVFLVVASAGAAVIATVLRTALDEATHLTEEVRRLGDLRPALVAIRNDAGRTADTARRLRSR